MRRTPGLQVHDGPVRVLVPKLGGLHNILGLTPLILRCGCGPGRGRGRLAGLAHGLRGGNLALCWGRGAVEAPTPRALVGCLSQDQ